MRRCFVLGFAALIVIAQLSLCRAQVAPLGNQAERLEWFRDQGFGMFIHWSMDSQLGSVISHSMVAADEGYLKRFVTELPKTFNPKRFEPEELSLRDKKRCLF